MSSPDQLMDPDLDSAPLEPEPKARPVGGTEYSWCKGVPGGTGTTVLAFFLSKQPDVSILQTALRNLQISHPILLSKLHFSHTTNSYSFLAPPFPLIEITAFDAASSAHILQTASADVTPFHAIVEHEINLATWRDPVDSPGTDVTDDVMLASLYHLQEESKWVLALRVHTGACDRTSALTLLKELLEGVGDGVEEKEFDGKEIGLEIEKCIPNGKTNKPFWARGMDMLGYSLNSLRLSNLDFRDAGFPRSSQFVRLQITSRETDQILAGCELRGIKLCAVLAAAGMIAANSSKRLPDDQWEKYSVATLMDCRPELDPLLHDHSLGFYHAAIVNTHDIKGGQDLWELATRCWTAFENAKNSNKHFSDMADLNFLMCKAIENPHLTPSSSMRTSLISVFENVVVEYSNQKHLQFGLDDYIGCASVHGVGPSIAIFDTIRDGCLDCPCVYPSPLHSREQISNLMPWFGTYVDCSLTTKLSPGLDKLPSSSTIQHRKQL